MNRIYYAASVLFVFLSFFSLNAQSIKRDVSFGDNGTIYLRDTRYDYTTYALFQDPASEEMLNAGIYYDYDEDASGLYFSKSNAAGALDVTFAENGVLRLSGDDYPFNKILRIRQAVDKSYLVLIGNADVYSADSTAIICFTSKGKVVTDFGDGGLLSGSKGLIRDFDILADAKLLALSTSVDTNTLEVSNWFGRYTQLGVSDASFGSGGYKEFGKTLSEYVRMNKVGQTYLCMGHSLNLSELTYVPVLCKVSSDGVQDKTFGEPAAVFGSAISSGALLFPQNIQSLKDGGFLLDGFSINLDSLTAGTFISKMDKNGQTVATFGLGGYVEFEDIWQGELYSLGAMEVSGGQILVSNTAVDNNDLLEMSFYLFDKNGAAVSNFGTQGNQRMKIEDQQTTVFAAFISPAGKIFVGGDVTNASDVFESQISKLLLNTVSVNDAGQGIGQVLLSPNPVSEKAELTYELTSTMLVSVDLLDMQGRTVQSFVNNQIRLAGNQKEEISIGRQIVPGVYTLQVRTSGRVLHTVKIVRM